MEEFDRTDQILRLLLTGPLEVSKQASSVTLRLEWAVTRVKVWAWIIIFSYWFNPSSLGAVIRRDSLSSSWKTDVEEINWLLKDFPGIL